MWVAGVADGARVIVQGQDFVREGQKVEPVDAAEDAAEDRRRADRQLSDTGRKPQWPIPSTTPSTTRG